MSSSYHKIFRALAITLSLGVAASEAALAQTAPAAVSGEEPKRYTLGGITISGARYLDANTLIGLTGLKIGDPITIPGEEVGKAIRKLWDQGILGDVSVSVDHIEGTRIFLDFNLKERPRLSKFEFSGIGKSQADELKNKIKLGAK
jgi:outer membrane protein insertion porin family